ncbi:MAG: hypothetical protein AAGE84_16785 [Cyanobacteria bacterium P01_G01_bin.39]
MNSIFLILSERLGKAIATVPSSANIRDLCLIISVYILFTLAWGWRSGFLHWQPQSGKIILRVMLS